MIPLLLLALLLPLPAQRRVTKAPPAPPPPDRWPIASLRIEGNKLIPGDAIVAATGLKPGQPVNRTDLEAAAARLTDTGVFETLSFRYDPQGQALAVTFQVQEVIDLYPIAFERLDAPDPDLMQFLRDRLPLFGPQVPATGAMVRRITDALQGRLGFPISGRLLPGPAGGLRMTFRPAAAPPSITFVQFEGSDVLRAVDLQKAFYQVAVGVPYTEPRLHELLDANIRPLFEEKGRLRVKFGPVRVEESKEATGVVVTVPVQDGDAFQFGSVRFQGRSQLPEKDLTRLAAPLESGAPANFALVLGALSNIERLYKRNGFFRVRAFADRAVDDQKKTVDLVLRIQEGEQYRLRELTIRGIDINAQAAVRKRWGIPRGQPFDDSYPDVFILRIQEEAMFDQLAKITHRVAIDEQSRMVDVELSFVAAPPPKTR